MQQNDIDTLLLIANSHEAIEITKALAKRYMQRYGTSSIEQITAPHAVAQTYDTVHILAKAARAAGSIEGEKIREALKSLKHHEGAVKTYEAPFATTHDALSVDDYKMVRVPYKQSGEL